ncbi:hypothetical protein HDU96_006494 [Phlyctochytrium bullatum]|nr:hypothetical protein HDU96_006494 [Phlyctochytrium bullatum]
MKAVDNIIQERRLLEEIQNPFICNLRFAFQDDENLFMVIDLMLGGDLRFHLDRMGTFTEDMVRFCVAEVTLGLAYLHSKRIVHRDLKPDNEFWCLIYKSYATPANISVQVLLDENGHASLTDFNIAVHYREEKPLTAVAGTPEVLAKKGYNNSVDWWSLGVMAYELLWGRRLGAKENGGDAKIREMSWFKSIDWEKLEAKEVTPPFIPDSKKANFDATHELEELLLEDNPLKAKPRKKDENGKLAPRQPPPGEDPEVTKMMNLMEEKFIVFDYTKPKPPKVGKTSQMDVKGSAKAIPQIDIKTTAVDDEEDNIRASIAVDPMEGRTDGVKMDGMTDGSPSCPEGRKVSDDSQMHD